MGEEKSVEEGRRVRKGEWKMERGSVKERAGIEKKR